MLARPSMKPEVRARALFPLPVEDVVGAPPVLGRDAVEVLGEALYATAVGAVELESALDARGGAGTTFLGGVA
jgi:hypothetical protein